MVLEIFWHPVRTLFDRLNITEVLLLKDSPLVQGLWTIIYKESYSLLNSTFLECKQMLWCFEDYLFRTSRMQQLYNYVIGIFVILDVPYC